MNQPLRSIRTLLALVVLTPIIAISIALLLLSSYTSRNIESRLSNSLVDSTSSIISYRVLDSLRDAQWISNLYTMRLNDGIIPEVPSAAWERMMYASISTRPTLSSVCFARADGLGVNVVRLGGDFFLSRAEGPGLNQTTMYALNDKGDPAAPPLRTLTYDVTKRPWYRQAIDADAPVWTPVYIWSLGDNQPLPHPAASVGYTRPVKRSDDSIIGVLSVDVSLETVEDLLGQSELAANGTLLLLDEKNRILCSTDRATRAGLDLINLADATGTNTTILRQAMAGVDDQSALHVKIGNRYISVEPIRPFPGINWRLAAIVPEGVISGETTILHRNMIVVGIICALAALILGQLLSRKIAGPIQRIAGSVRKIGRGDFDATFEPQKTNELAELTASLTDMTRQLSQQVALRAQKEAVERAAEAKGAFFHRVTHELRTPLNAIIGYGEMLDEQPVIRADPTAREDVRRLLQAGRQLLRLINELLDLARIDAGRTRLNWADVDLTDLLREVEETARPLIRPHRNVLQVNLQTDHLQLRTDPQKLKQILLNLLANSAKFTQDGRIELRVRSDQAHICFSVIDTGVGIEKDQIARMFEPFAQADVANDGTGLGLTITRQLTRLLGGEIDLSSEPGVGTRVDVYFPLSAESVLHQAGEVADELEIK